MNMEAEIIRAAGRKLCAEMSWILESNEAMNRVLRHINARITKTYVLYEKSLARPEAGLPA